MSVRAADALAAMMDMPLLSFGQLAIRGLIVVAPHPDDESLGCGGLIAAATAEDIPVRIVVVSDGAGIPSELGVLSASAPAPPA